MIFVYSKKTFMDKHKKLLKVKPYTIIDGLCDDSDDIGRKFSHVAPVGDFAPGNKLINGMLALEKGKHLEISEHKIADMKDNFLTGKSFIAACLCVAKALLYESEEVKMDKNIFIVIPTKAYKALGKEITREFRNLFKDHVDCKFIFSEDHVAKDSDLLDTKFKRSYGEDLAKRIKKLEKKYKLK